MADRSKMESVENLKGKRVLVTGGTGFIGSHLVDELIKLEAKVVVVDILCHAASYFAAQKLHKKVELEFADIAVRPAMENIIATYRPEYIFHLAAEAIVNDAYENPQ